MSLLQNQDFILYRIRSRYLQSVSDGVGDRLITLNPTALNLPAYKNAGWAVAQDIKRTYSPPIPTGTTGEYFAPPQKAPRTLFDAPTPAAGLKASSADQTLNSKFSEDSLDSTLPGSKTSKVDLLREGRRAHRRMHREQVDSSDDSNESDDDDHQNESDRPSQKILFDFTKKELPHRPRAGSSPLRNGPQVMITSPSVSKARTRRLRGGSHGDVEFKSTNDQNSLPRADEQLLSSGIIAEQEKIHADIVNKLRSSPNSSLPQDNEFDSGDDSDASSTMSLDFLNTADSNPHGISNSKTTLRASPAVFKALPPPIRPVSQVMPVSLLSQALKLLKAEDESPLAGYATFSGKGELTPAYLKIYIPFAPGPPMEIIINRVFKEPSGQTRDITVSEAIGFTLYVYDDEKKQPALKAEQKDINRWTFRMVDDGEPDDDLPALERTQPMAAFLTKKLPRRGRGEARLEGEFALVEATEEQYKENCRVTPFAVKKPTIDGGQPNTKPSATQLFPPTAMSVHSSPIPTLGPSTRQLIADQLSTTNTSRAANRIGPTKIIRIHLSTIEESTQSVSICATTDTYISEVLDQICRKRSLDKSKFMLRLHDHPNVIAPLDRTVASLGVHAELELVRRRFIGATEGIGDRPGSPSTTGSPNAPILPPGSSGKDSTHASRTPGKKSKFLQSPSIWTPDIISSRDYLKFNVYRKSSVAFMSQHKRILAIDGEYVHIMPSDQKTLLNALESQTKTRSIHVSTIIGCKVYRKQLSSFKILVMRPEKETKRYDFEAENKEQAAEVVEAVLKARAREEQERKAYEDL